MKNRLKAKNWYYEKKNELGIDPVLYKRHERKQSMLDLIGSKCQICGYDKLPMQNLVFHHLDPLKKNRDLSVNHFNYLFIRMKDELMKCAIFCHNCHGEIHYSNIHSEAFLQSLNEILKSKIVELTDWPSQLQKDTGD